MIGAGGGRWVLCCVACGRRPLRSETVAENGVERDGEGSSVFQLVWRIASTLRDSSSQLVLRLSEDPGLACP